MAKTVSMKPLVATVGAAFIAGMASVSVVNAAENPFASTELNGGYAQLAEKAEGKCGEAKCGGDKKAEREGSCGEGKAAAEGKCGGDKSATEGKCGGDKVPAEGKCGEDKSAKKASAEGKCGEGKCGGKG